MKPRLLLPTLGLSLFAMVMVLSAGAQTKQAPPAADKDELAAKEQQLARQFDEFQLLLLKLKQRMERGTPDEQNRAKAIGRILDEVQRGSLKIEFDRLADLLRESKLNNSSEVKDLVERAGKLTDELQRLLRMFQDDPRAKQLLEERKFLEIAIRKLEQLIKDEKQVQGQTEANKTDKNELAQTQAQVAKKTNDLNKAIDNFLGKKGDGVAQDAKNLKGGPKEGGKNEKSSAVAKDDGEKNPEGSQGTAKAGGDEKDPMTASTKGDAKGDDKSGDGQSQAKQGEGDPNASPKTAQGSEPKEGSQAKNNEGAKGNEASSKNNEGANKGNEASAKTGEPSSAKPSPSQAKQGEGSKPGSKEGKPSEGAQGSQAKQGSPSESQASKAPKGEAKAGNDSQGKSQAKTEGEMPPSQASQGSPSQPQAKADHGAQSSEIKVNDGPTPPQQPGNQKTKDTLAQNQKKILEAGYDMVKAENKIIQGEKKPAIQNQQSAIDNLEEAKKKLEDLLRQTREEELERLLAALEARCRKMLEMQIAVLAGTEATHKAVLSRAEKKPSREDQQNALKLSDNEKDIIMEANKAIQMLEEEGSGVAFPEVFQQVREDMKHVQRRLEIADVAEVTQAVEKDIIASLQEMIEALKKAQQQNKGSGKPSESGPPPDQKLLDKIAELKMIRSLQKRVNDRTQFYGRLFPNEQALDTNLRQQLQGLAERQERIFEIMDRFAKGDGK
jgi:hypothetical protein